MNTTITLEIAKLLKEKGFNLLVNNYFSDNGREEHFQTEYKANHNSSVSVGLKHSRPTIAEVVMWLYETHKIWISVTKDVSVNWANDYFDYYILSPNRTTGSNIGGTQPTSPTEAYLSGITYTLNNLL